MGAMIVAEAPGLVRLDADEVRCHPPCPAREPYHADSSPPSPDDPHPRSDYDQCIDARPGVSSEALSPRPLDSGVRARH